MMILQLPWTMVEEEYLGHPAYSLMQVDGGRCAVGLVRDDALLICRLVNAMAEVLTKDTIFDYFAAMTRDSYRDLDRLPEREVTEEVYDYFLGILPPRYLSRGGFAVPEAVTTDASGTVYSCFEKRGSAFLHSYRKFAS